MSASHVAFGSTRVMATCAHNGQAIGMAARLCLEKGVLPREISSPNTVGELQAALLQTGHYIPKVSLKLNPQFFEDIRLDVSSEFELDQLPFDGPWKPLDFSMAQLLPLPQGDCLSIELGVRASRATTLKLELRKSQKTGNYTWDELVETQEISVSEGEATYSIDFDYQQDISQYLAFCLIQNDYLEIKTSKSRVSGLVTVFNKFNKSVATSSIQSPPKGIGIDEFEFWVPERRPEGYNLGMVLNKPIKGFGKENLTNGVFRPTLQSNAWVSSLEDPNPSLSISWESQKLIHQVKLFFDTDFDHALESTLMGHPESEIPFCVSSFRLKNGNGELLFSEKSNHQTVYTISLDSPVETKGLILELDHPHENVPAALFGFLLN